MKRKEEEELKEVSPEEVPDFASEAEEAEFWASHTLNEEFWEKAEQTPREDQFKRRD